MTFRTRPPHARREAQLEKARATEFLVKIHAALGNACAHCGFVDARALQIDHVEGGGGKELRKSGNRRFYYRKVWLSLEAGERVYQLLCANCNWIKRAEAGEGAPRYLCRILPT